MGFRFLAEFAAGILLGLLILRTRLLAYCLGKQTSEKRYDLQEPTRFSGTHVPAAVPDHYVRGKTLLSFLGI